MKTTSKQKSPNELTNESPNELTNESPNELTNESPNEWDSIYIDIVKNVLSHGFIKKARDLSTLALNHIFFSLNLNNGFPLLTTKKVNHKLIAQELIWDISGSSNVNDLPNSAKKLWKHWADEDGNIPSSYGRFLVDYPRYYQEDLKSGEAQLPVYLGSVNQLGNIITTLLGSPHSRRMVATFWHPANASGSKQPPCHLSLVFSTRPLEDGLFALDLLVTQRSADVALGLVFDVAKYALLTHLIANYCQMKVGKLSFAIADCHIYEQHITKLQSQILRKPRKAPQIVITNFTTPCEFAEDDYEIIDYDPHPYTNYELVVN
jgi:thymidylate synthase